jgi:hypothetical protein
MLPLAKDKMGDAEIASWMAEVVLSAWLFSFREGSLMLARIANDRILRSALRSCIINFPQFLPQA